MSPVLFWVNNATIDRTNNCYRKNNFSIKIFSDEDSINTLFNAVIGLAALSGVLALLLAMTVYLICKMRSTRRNAIKTDVNPVYGIDYEEGEVVNSLSLFYFLSQEAQAGSAKNKEAPKSPNSFDYDYMGE